MPGAPPYVRPSLGAVPRYAPGRSLAASDGPTYKLSSNENPFPPVPAVAAAAAAAAAATNRYPDMASRDLVAALSHHLDVAPERVVVGAGSVGVLGQLFQAACEPGSEVVMAWRSFEAYPIAARVAGADVVQVSSGPDGRHDLAAMAGAVTERTRALMVCTPNNPTGPAARHDEVVALLDAVAGRCLVVLDEAYVEFVRDPAAVDSLALAREHDNVVVLRTFSKAHGLASLRVGYGVAHEPVADGLRATAVPFGVSTVAQAAALAALDSLGDINAQVASIVRERERVHEALIDGGWRVPDPQGNFVWLALGEDTERFVAACAARGVTVRGFAGEGVRCSIGEPAGNDIVLEVAGDDRWAARRAG